MLTAKSRAVAVAVSHSWAGLRLMLGLAAGDSVGAAGEGESAIVQVGGEDSL